MRKRLALIAGLAASLSAVSARAAETPAPAWAKDLAQAQSRALKEKRPILLYFRADWCAACGTVDKTVIGAPQFRSIASRTVLLKADVDTEEGSALKAQRRVHFIPAFVMIEPDGGEAGRITGPLAAPVLLSKLEGFLARRRTPR
jgi:thiol:disulfide interchange protein DsbD